MSLLNDKAVQDILLEPDILSEEGRIQSIWDLFTTNVKYQEGANTILKAILKNTDENVIKHLVFGDAECLPRIRRFHKMVSDVSKMGVSTSNLSNFMYALDNSLIDYISIKDESSTNIKINMGGFFEDPSYHDQAVILSAMTKNGLIDSGEIQSLLDDQNIGILTAANSCITTCSGGEPPSGVGCGVHLTSELSLNDFGTRTEEIINCIRSLLKTDADLFPNSPSELRQMIFSEDDFDVHSIFRQGTYASNLASYCIMSVSSQYFQDSFELDNETAIYQLSSLMNRLRGFIDHFNNMVCLLIYMVAGALIIRYLKTKASGDDPDVASKIYTLKRNIANAYSRFMGMDQAEPSKISDTVRTPKELEDFVKSAGCGLSVDSLFGEDNSGIWGDADEALKGILSGIEEMRLTLEESCSYDALGNATVTSSDDNSALSSPTESIGFEQALETNRQTLVRTVMEAATKFHRELNHSLLGRNFENAANQIALEAALLEQIQIDNRLINSLDVKSIADSIQRDILTYEDRVNVSSSGVSSYQSSAKAYIESLLNG